MKNWEELECLTKRLNTLQIIKICSSDYRNFWCCLCLVSECSRLANSDPVTKALVLILKPTTHAPTSGPWHVLFPPPWKFSRNIHNLLSFLFQASAYQSTLPRPFYIITQDSSPPWHSFSPLPCFIVLLNACHHLTYGRLTCSLSSPPRISAPWGPRLCMFRSVSTLSVFNTVQNILENDSRKHACSWDAN